MSSLTWADLKCQLGSDMELFVAGKDRSSDIGVELTRRSIRHQGALSPWSPADSALTLKESTSPDDYLDRTVRLMRLRGAVSTEAFPIPGRSGAAGTLLRKIKTILWKLLRYQHDRMAFQQNAINELIIGSIEFQQSVSKQTVGDLERRVAQLETELASLRNTPPKPPAHPSPLPSPSGGEGEDPS